MPHELPQGPWEKLPIDFFEFCGLRVIPFSSATSRFYPALTVIRSAKTGLRNASSFYDPSASKSKEIKASCVNLGWKSQKNTHKVAFSGAEERSANSLTEVPRLDKAKVGS